TVMHSANIDVALSDPGIAGGLSITWRYDPNHFTIMGVVQNNGDQLFGYELSDYVPPAIDASVDSSVFNPPYSVIPEFETVPYDFRMVTHNAGTDPIADLESIFYIEDTNGTVLFAPTSQHDLNVTPAGDVTASFGTY